MPDVVDSCVFGGAWGLLKRHCLNNGVTLQTRACKREENYAKKRLPEGHMAAALAHHVAASLLCGAYLCLSVAGAAILGDSGCSGGQRRVLSRGWRAPDREYRGGGRVSFSVGFGEKRICRLCQYVCQQIWDYAGCI